MWLLVWGWTAWLEMLTTKHSMPYSRQWSPVIHTLRLATPWRESSWTGLINSWVDWRLHKGCQVHFTRSVKRVAERVNKGDPQGFKAFTTVAYTIPKANSPEDISKLFNVLAGEADISTLAEVSGLSKTLKKFNHTPKSWKTAKHWVNWWRRPNHLSKFVLGCSLSVLW